MTAWPRPRPGASRGGWARRAGPTVDAGYGLRLGICRGKASTRMRARTRIATLARERDHAAGETRVAPGRPPRLLTFHQRDEQQEQPGGQQAQPDRVELAADAR